MKVSIAQFAIAVVAAIVFSATAQAETNPKEYKIEVAAKSPLYKRVKQYLPGDVTETYRMRHADSFVKNGWDLLNKKRYDQALDAFFLAINMNGREAPAYFGVAYVCSVQENYTDAVTFYRAALHYEKKYAPVYHNLAKALCLQNEKSPPDEVVSLLEQAIALDPKSSDHYLTFCGYYMQKRSWKEAGKMYQKALDLGAKGDPSLTKELKRHGSL